jgi:hypothetical protein
MKLVEKRFNLEVLKNFESGKKEWLVPFVSDDFKACERKARWYRNKANLGLYVGYTKEDLKNIRIWDKQNNVYTNI